MAQEQFTHKVIQGFSVVWTTYIVDGNGNAVVFAGTEPLACEVWAGGTQPVLFNPSVAFNTAALGTIDVTYSSANTLALPIGFYDVVISRSDTDTALAFGYVSVAPAPGSTSLDLISIPFARASLSDFNMTPTQIEFLPQAITAASNIVVRWCGNRDFIQKNYTEDYQVTLDGTVILNQPPNWIIRVQGNPHTALTIQNTSSSVQEAYVSGSFTGDQSIGLTTVGLNLTRVSNGTVTTTPIAFTANMTLSGLVTAISAAGGGWTSFADTSYVSWPVTELLDLQVPGPAMSGSGASYSVFVDELGSDAKIDPLGTGLLWVGRQYKGTGPKWGPDWMQFDSPVMGSGRVRVSYNAGFATIPMVIQKCVASIAKNMLAVLSRDPTIMREKTISYEYWLDKVVDIVPAQDVQALGYYRLYHA